MGVKSNQEYSKEFKIDAIKLAKDLGSVAEAARKLGVSAKNIYNWMARYAVDGAAAFPGKGKLPPEEQKMATLEAENRRLKMELEFLKKAASYFAAQQK